MLTTAVPLSQLFLSPEELDGAMAHHAKTSTGAKSRSKKQGFGGGEHDGGDSTRMLTDDIGLSVEMIKTSKVFSGDEERFAFARALSRLSEMGSQEWIERGMGLEQKGGKTERDSWQRGRSRWREDSL